MSAQSLSAEWGDGGFLWEADHPSWERRAAHPQRQAAAGERRCEILKKSSGSSGGSSQFLPRCGFWVGSRQEVSGSSSTMVGQSIQRIVNGLWLYTLRWGRREGPRFVRWR